MMDINEYQEFENDCLAELAAKQGRIADILLLDANVDAERARVQFVDRDEVFAEADIILVGSWGHKSSSWMWGWANSSMSAPLRAASSNLKELASTTGRAEFSTEHSFPATDREARAFAAIACRQFGGDGVYTTMANDSVWFFVIRNPRRCKAPERFQAKVEEAVRNALLEAQGAEKFNILRGHFPEIRPEFIEEDLRGDPLPWTNDLHVQPLVDQGYVQKRHRRDLAGVNLSRLRLDGAIMRGITLRAASFEGASLVDADLSGIDGRDASFRNAFLNGANFTGARLAGADFSGAELARTLLTHVDLSEVQGLNEVRHSAASEISFSTLIDSKFHIEPSFLRKAGVSRGLIQDLINGKKLSTVYQSCFLSYSSKDREFAEQAYSSLAEAGVRIFFDYFDVVPGEFLNDQIMEAIREHDRLLVILSDASMASAWVVREIELARYHKPESLVPVRLCPLEDVKRWTGKHKELPDLVEMFPILDFSGWRIRAEYEHALALLLKALSGK